MSFLTKQVGEDTTDTDDYKKLTRDSKYMCRTEFLCLTIESTYLGQNYWIVNTAFAVHVNMQSHTGAYTTFGEGMIDGAARGQQINTTSSTKAGVVGVHESMPAIVWIRYFLDAR